MRTAGFHSEHALVQISFVEFPKTRIYIGEGAGEEAANMASKVGGDMLNLLVGDRDLDDLDEETRAAIGAIEELADSINPVALRAAGGAVAGAYLARYRWTGSMASEGTCGCY